MAADLTITQGDSTPVFTDTILDASGNPVNLTSASVTFVMRNLANASPTVNASASITNAAAGEVQYSWNTGDTATAGEYMVQWRITLSGGGTYTYPNVGYRSVEVQPNLSSAGQQLITVAEAKDVLNFTADDDVHDTKILRWISACRSVIEAITGPIIQTNYDEWYDGGQYWIMLRHPPHTGYGTTPVCTINFVETYIGPIEYQFTGVGNPVTGSIYTYEVDTFSRLVRRGPGGGIIPFPNMPQSVHVGYTSGQSSVPDNVREATAELLRHNYQKTAQSTNKGWGDAGEPETPPRAESWFIPPNVRQLLGPTKRAPAFF